MHCSKTECSAAESHRPSAERAAEEGSGPPLDAEPSAGGAGDIAFGGWIDSYGHIITKLDLVAAAQAERIEYS